MLKNRFKEKITERVFDNEPLNKVYEMICNLEAPYLWYTDRFHGEQLYLIEDIETQKDVPSYRWQIDDVEFMEPDRDVIGLRLCRMSGKYEHKTYVSISCISNNANINISAESLLKQAGVKIPNTSEVESVNFTGDLPGNKKEVDEKLKKERIKHLKESILEDESKIATYENKRAVLESVLCSLKHDIDLCTSRVEFAHQRIDLARKELRDLQAEA